MSNVVGFITARLDAIMQDQDALRVLDELAPPCEYNHHNDVGSSLPAAWVVVMDLRRTCACPLLEVRLFCDPCWSWRNKSGRVVCRRCGRIFLCMETVLRVERL